MITHPSPRRAPAAPTHPPASGLSRALRRWLSRTLHTMEAALARSRTHARAERSRQHFHARGHTWFLLFHALSRSPSLRQSYARFAAAPDLLTRSGLARVDGRDGLAVSFSQVAASNTSRPAAWLAGLLPVVLAQVRQQGLAHLPACPLDWQVLDGTFVPMCLRLSGWAPHTRRSDIPGVRMHVRYAPAWDLPDRVVISTTRLHEGTVLAQQLAQPALVARWQGQTLIFDLGYYSHVRFAAIQAAGIHWITRHHPTATLVVEADLPVQAPLPDLPAGPIVVRHDQRVRVGSPSNHQSTVLAGLRLVTAEVAAPTPGGRPVTYTLLTDRWDLSAHEVVQAYRWRWQIELFFRWLKQHLHLTRLLGGSRNAVELTIWLTLLGHLLTVWAAAALGQHRSPTMVALLGDAMLRLTGADLALTGPEDLLQLGLPWDAAPGSDSS